MELMLEQMPIVIRSLNVGFLQTLKLFAVTLLGGASSGACHRIRLHVAFSAAQLCDQGYCLDHTRNAVDDTAFDHLLFSGAGA